MRICNSNDVKAFNKLIDSCGGAVWAESVYGDRYNLKSELSRTIAIAELMRDKKDRLELYASSREDEAKLTHFVKELYRRSA